MVNKLKLIVSICCLTLFSLILVSCGGNNPSAVVKKFVKAVENGDAKAIGQISTPETAQMIAMYMGKQYKF